MHGFCYYKLTEFLRESGQGESSGGAPLKRRHVFRVPPPFADASERGKKQSFVLQRLTGR